VIKVKVEYEHPAQSIASGFLRAIADDDARGAWERLSRESRGLLRGLHAARSGRSLSEAIGEEGDVIAPVVAPLRAAVLRVLGSPERVGAFGVSAARVVDRGTVYVLLVPDVTHEGLIAESEWRPAHLIALVYGSREWLVDLGRTAALSAEAELPDPLGAIR
jgi:hypothetical protein